MANLEWGNKTAITEFILLGFGELPELRFLLFLLFLVIFVMTMVGNILIIVLVVIDQHLHTPMYFFLVSLSCLETCNSSNILPRLLASFLTGDRAVTFTDCLTQYYFFGCLAATECYLLAAMSYDRYIAICKPLHYATIMSTSLCLQLSAGVWISGFLTNTILTGLIVNLVFCGPKEIDHFFCDAFPLMKLSCSDTHLAGLATSTVAFVCSLPPFLLTLTSYICIIITILRIPSTRGRKKAFSTCSSHLIVVTVFYWSILTVYVLPYNDKLKDMSKVFSVFFTVLTPMINPHIYSLRNKEVKKALRQIVNLKRRELIQITLR
ncbi:olfactory receptor 1020-like [Alligator sinensis]|uniref:Olfactory receptor n=1 Tax=Alligator sinensis TaxID=38654 RepID=A0A3Q0FUZ8_ALLSI|nr:olfactory receptor 1020-like [Alligator sinensis]